MWRAARCPVLVARGDIILGAIIGLDGSIATEHTLDALASLPLPPGIETTVIHFIHPGEVPHLLQLGPGLSGETMIDQFDRQHQAMGERIARHAQAHLSHDGRDAQTDVRCGAPADEMVAAAQEAGADLIVVGAGNKSALGRLFLGSVSGRVLSHAPCSVLVARAGLEGSGTEDRPAHIAAAVRTLARRGEPAGRTA